jgi:hypothetical protein
VSIVLLDLMGGVALLLWGRYKVLSGVLRAFGPDLRRYLGKALRNRCSAFAAGELRALETSKNDPAGMRWRFNSNCRDPHNAARLPSAELTHHVILTGHG